MSKQEPQPLPPRCADRLLESFCAPHLLEEVQGDLYELYNKWLRQYGARKANRLYAWHALKFFRPFTLTRHEPYFSINTIAMFKNYLTIGIRNILKYKVFSFINVFGLAVAMAVCMLIMLMLADQTRYDKFHTKKDRIYRIISEPENAKSPYATTPIPLAAVLNSDYPVVEAATQLIPGVGGEMVYDEQMAEVKGFFADTSFFRVFSYPLEKGDTHTALSAPNSVLITRSMADRLFKDEDPIGKMVDFTDRGLPLLGEGAGEKTIPWGLLTITGVIADKDVKSHLHFDVLVSAATMPALYAQEKITDHSQDWAFYFYGYTYVLLYPEHEQPQLTASLHDIAERHYADSEDLKNFQLGAQPLNDITPGPVLGNTPTYSLPQLAYYFLGGMALIIMVLACLNYTNLSVARVLTRTKEIGVRKITGARRKDLMYQFLSESVLVALLALALAMVLLVFLKPAFTGLWVNQYLNFDLQENSLTYVLFIAFALFIGCIAGLYPAVYLSGHLPMQVLKNSEKLKPGKLGMRKVLSTSQFVVSLFFMVTSLLIFNQFKHLLTLDYGFDAESIVNIPLQGNDYTLVSHEMNTLAEVVGVSASEYIPATGTNNGNSLRKAGSEDDYIPCISLPADEHFIHTLNIPLVAGQNLPASGTSSERFILVNEAAAKAFGYDTPAEIIGQVLDSEWSDTDVEVIGVVKDFRIDLSFARQEIRPMVMQNLQHLFKYAQVKVVSTDLKGTLAKMQEKWKNIDPVHPLKYELYEQQISATHQGLWDVVSIVGFITFLAITIACLGMLGMATYLTERRTKEVGIRKVLGAEDLGIALMLSRSFIRILLISVLIGAPLSFLLNNLWLQHFPNRVDFGPGTILTAALILIVLGLVTVGSCTLVAARRNPVEAIRVE